MIIPGQTILVSETVYKEGEPAAPDSITAILYRVVAGVRSASGVTVTTATTANPGEYTFTWTNDAGWNRTDDLELKVIPVIDSVSYPMVVWRSHGHVDAVMRGTDNVAIPTLSGPNTVTISVVDQDTSAPIEGALVKLYRTGSGQETQATDVNGEAVFTVVDATWQIGVTEGTHIGASDVIVVPSELSKVVAMARKSFPSAGDPDAAMLRITCYGAGTAIAPGAIVRLRMCTPPTGTEGGSFDGSIRELIADSNGIIDVEVFKNSVYQTQRGESRTWERIATDNDDNQFAKNFIGVD